MSKIKYKIESLLNDIERIETNNFNTNVEERLEKVLLKYIIDLDKTCDRVLNKRIDIVFKELAK